MTRASVSRSNPRALAICDRCGMRYNHYELQWQFQWMGPRLQNLRLLVCRSCLDVPNEGLRTIVLPPDPVPISNPRPERYEVANNPNSPIGQGPLTSIAGSNIGTLIGGGGTYAAFDGNAFKKFFRSANLSISNSSYGNWVGKDWNAGASTSPTKVSYTVSGFTFTAPLDSAFLGSSGIVNYRFQGSSDGSTWTDLVTGTTAGEVGESITTTLDSGSAYQYHRLDLVGDGTNEIAIAQLEIDTNRGVRS